MLFKVERVTNYRQKKGRQIRERNFNEKVKRQSREKILKSTEVKCWRT